MVDRSVKVYLKGDISDYERAMLEARGSTAGFSKSLDSSTDRMSNLVQTALALGPALVPISAAAVPAIAGLTNQLGIGVAAVGVTVLAFKGLGKALDAVNNASLEPTAENIQKMNLQLSQLGPAGQDFVLFLQRARPELQHLQELSRAGMFPGIETGIRSLSGLLPNVEHLITTISTTLGELASEAGANLDSPKWRDFITFLDKEARPTLLEMGRTAGNFAEGLANLWMAFAPLENNFSSGFLGLSRDFAKWTDGLDKTQGFQDFLAYVEKQGPEAFDTLGSLANALLQIIEAAAPVGSAVLPVIKALSDAVAALADSNLGPLVIGIISVTAAFTRLQALGRAGNAGILGNLLGKSSYGGTLTQVKALPGALLAVESASERANTKAGALSATSARLGASLGGAAKLAGGAAGLAFIMSGTADKMNLSNTATLALAGSLAGPWGTAVSAGIGLALDFAHHTDSIGAAMDRATLAVQQNRVSLAAQKAAIDQVRAAQSQNGDPVPGGRGVATNTTGAAARNAADLAKLEAQYDKNKAKAQDAAFAEAGLSAQMANSSKASRDETYALLENIKTKNAAADATENAFSAETNYRQALKDAQAQARTNNAGIKGSSDAVLKNRTSLDQLASAWNRVADAGNASSGDLKKARSNFIAVATAMGVPAAAARALARELLHIPSPKPKISLSGAKEAAAAIKAVKDLLSNLNGKTATTTIVTLKRTKTLLADGGEVSGEIRGPGGPRDDLIPIMASNKEIVVNARDAQEHRDLILGINAGMFRGRSPLGYANGGEVLQRIAPSGYLGPQASGAQPLSVSVVGMRVSLDKDGFGTFVDGRIDIGLANAADFAGTVGRMG